MNRKWIIAIAAVVVVAGGAVGGTIYYLKTRGPKPITPEEVKAALDPMKLSAMKPEERKALLNDIARRLPTMTNEQLVKTAQEMGGPRIAMLYAQLTPEEREALVQPLAESKRKEFTQKAKEYYALPPSKRKEALDAQIAEFNSYRRALMGVAGGMGPGFGPPGGGRRGGPPGAPPGAAPGGSRSGSVEGQRSGQPGTRGDRGNRRPPVPQNSQNRKEMESRMLTRAQRALNNTTSEERAITMAYMEEIRKRQRELESQR